MSVQSTGSACQWTRGLGLLLTGVSAIGLCGAVWLARVQVGYYQIKYGRYAELPLSQMETLADTLWQRYPAHYYICLHMAEGWWEAAGRANGTHDAEALSAARRWIDRGLSAHPLLSDFHLLNARQLALDDPHAAAAAWDAYADRHFWNAFNQAMRVDFYVQAEAFTRASETLALLHGRPHHEWARERFRAGLHASMRPPTRP